MLLVFLLAFPLLTGCWDRLEIEERAVVLGVGIDKANPKEKTINEDVSHAKDENVEQLGLIKITVQIAVPGRIPLGPGEGGGGGGGGGGPKTVWVVDAIGSTVSDAFNVLQQRVSQPLFFGHLRIIVLSESMARRGIDNLNDYFRRNPEVRRMGWMIVCKGQASDIMNASPQLERVPTLYSMTTMEQAVKMGRFPNDFLGIFWNAVSAKGKEGYLPYVVLMEDQNIQISGLAYFNSDKLAGVTDPYDITLYMGIMGSREAGGESYVKIPNSNDYVMVQSRSRKSNFKTRIVNGKPHVTINVLIEANILSKSSSNTELDKNVAKLIERQIEKNAAKKYKDFIAKIQKSGSDIFGFGEHVRAIQPGYWNREVQSAEKWAQIFKETTVDVAVTIHIRRIGMKAT
ncbi:Ger(x)C family spore germination protein [Paenibacillus piri]|uniref:Ger(X)C family spore germination protein n=2 Tax=Paenibacillus piri TaxID=2547395 RepID=A0A4R5KM71_9BACL|nr:Ger(x)C family spore germination protein [Paenibacillus piri]